MKNKIKDTLLHTILPVLFWLGVWQVGALIVDNSYFLPSIPDTLSALLRIVVSQQFLLTVSLTVLRALGGIALGTVVGGIFAILSNKIRLIHSLISPLNSVIKATPIASVIILLWISLEGNTLTVIVSFLMVFPIIWQNLYDAFSSIDGELIELSRVFGFSYKKRLNLLVFPALKKYFIPAFVTSIGLAFKAEIAAEIIAGVRNSIGQMIYEAKDAPDIPRVFAWTIVGVAFSILFEKLARLALIPKSDRKKEAEV